MKKEINIFKSIKASKYFEMFPSFKEEKAQFFLTIILTLVSFSFFGIFAIGPTLSTIAELKKELSDSKFVNEKLEQKITNLYSLQQKYSLLENELTIVMAALPKTPNESFFVGQIQAIGQKTNTIVKRINISEIELSKEQKQNKYSSFAFSAEISGTYKDLTSFLSLLTDYERIVTIDTVSVAKSTEKNDTLQLNIRGRAYFKG